MKQMIAVMAKDLRSEMRGKEIAPAMLMFAVTLVFVVTFVLPLRSGHPPSLRPVAGLVPTQEVASTFLWLGILFAAIVGFGRGASQERESSRIEGLILAPIDPAILFLSKAGANFVLLLALQVVLIPIFVLFTGISLGSLLPGIVWIALAADIGLACIGTLFAAASQHSRVKEVLLPLLLFPTSLPLLLSAIALTNSQLIGEIGSSSTGWFILIAVFDVMFIAIGTTTYEFVVAE